MCRLCAGVGCYQCNDLYRTAWVRVQRENRLADRKRPIRRTHLYSDDRLQAAIRPAQGPILNLGMFDANVQPLDWFINDREGRSLPQTPHSSREGSPEPQRFGRLFGLPPNPADIERGRQYHLQREAEAEERAWRKTMPKELKEQELQSIRDKYSPKKKSKSPKKKRALRPPSPVPESRFGTTKAFGNLRDRDKAGKKPKKKGS